MILAIGEILFDIFPDTKRIGGAPFNFSYHLKQFGLPVRFISRVGRDEYGAEILRRIEAAGFDPGDIQRDSRKPTGSVRVTLDKRGVPEFDITPDVAYDYIDLKHRNYEAHLKSAGLVYFGTLLQRTTGAYHQLQHFIDRKRPDTRVFYDINLRRGGYSDQIVETSLYKADILKLNLDELRECQRIAKMDCGEAEFIRYLFARYSLDTVALTRGEKGSALYTKEGHRFVAPESRGAVVDTVGAGDAYAAMLVAGILKKWPIKSTLERATAFASRICSIEGAIPDSAEFYEPFRELITNGD